MTFEEVLPELKQDKQIRRISKYGILQIIKCGDDKIRLRMWRSGVNYTYTLTADDLLATDWEIL